MNTLESKEFGALLNEINIALSENGMNSVPSIVQLKSMCDEITEAYFRTNEIVVKTEDKRKLVNALVQSIISTSLNYVSSSLNNALNNFPQAGISSNAKLLAIGTSFVCVYFFRKKIVFKAKIND